MASSVATATFPPLATQVRLIPLPIPHSGLCIPNFDMSAISLKDKTALITGGGSGIGLGCALALAREGCRVAIAGRRLEVLKAGAAQWTGPSPILFSACDVGDRTDVEKLFAWANQKLQRIDILVN